MNEPVTITSLTSADDGAGLAGGWACACAAWAVPRTRRAAKNEPPLKYVVFNIRFFLPEMDLHHV
jgi:hypothetical protein